MNRYRSLAALLCAAVLASCEKNAVQDITGPLPSAQIKFFNFGVNAPGVNFYANDVKMTAISATSCTPPTDPACLSTGKESTTGTNYGGVGSGGFYGAITPGQYTLSGRISGATDNGLAISNVAATIAGGKAYSFYQSGFYDATAKTVDGFVVEDPVPALDLTVAYVRFVNAISNSSPMTLYAKLQGATTETAIGGAAAYKEAGGFTALPEGVYDLGARTEGSATNAISRTGVSFSAGHVYTIGARGDITITSTTDAKRPILDNTANR